MEELKQHAVYSHSFSGEVFYIGSGRIYTKEEKSTSRPYDFINRSKDWFNYCNRETKKIKVEILFETTNKQLAYDREEEITRMYIEKGFPLVNVSIGAHLSAETRNKISESTKGEKNHMWGKNLSTETINKISLAMSDENHPMAKKVLIVNNETGEQINFPTIKGAYEFISQNGFDKTKRNLQYYLDKGPYNFKEYTFEKIA